MHKISEKMFFSENIELVKTFKFDGGTDPHHVTSSIPTINFNTKRMDLEFPENDYTVTKAEIEPTGRRPDTQRLCLRLLRGITREGTCNILWPRLNGFRRSIPSVKTREWFTPPTTGD